MKKTAEASQTCELFVTMEQNFSTDEKKKKSKSKTFWRSECGKSIKGLTLKDA